LLEEKLDPFLGPTVYVPVSVLSSGKELLHRYTIRPKLRGVYNVGPLSVSWNDPFGLTRGEAQLAEKAEILVHPATELIYDRPLTRQWEDPPIRPPKTKPWSSGFEFYGMRDYVAGDDLRRIVWRAVARTGRLMVRESEQGVTDQVIIVLDTGRQWHKPGSPSETFETAVRAAASFGTKHLKDGFAVTLEANSARLAAGLRGSRAKLGFLDELARVQMEEASLGSTIKRLASGSKARAHYIVITPHLTETDATGLGLLTASGLSVLVAAIVWEEFQPQTERLAVGMGAQVVHLKPGYAMAGITAHSLGAGIKSQTAGAGVP
jgi:uncharacterized protein (DUF58 family)